jgi:energy-coupling factor transport system permease protein
MEARCYHGGEGRTQMKPLRYEKRDYVAYALMLAFAAASVCFCVFGGGWI